MRFLFIFVSFHNECYKYEFSYFPLIHEDAILQNERKMNKNIIIRFDVLADFVAYTYKIIKL